MSYASDKLYNGYLRVKMPVIVTRVKPRDIMMYLPCLTAHDREEIEAKTETRGSFNGMTLLLECLKRRENWPDQFIEALEACEHRALAAEVQAEYNALKHGNNSTPSSPPTTVITAHVHPAPSASHLSGPESGANSAAAAAAAAPAPPAEAPPALPEPAPQAPPPLETPESKPPKAVSSPEPVPKPPQSTQIEVPSPPSTPPPSPETPHLLWAAAATADPQPQKQTNPHQEPEENSESDTQDVPVDAGLIPDQVSSGDGEVLVDPAPPPHRPVEQCETEAPPCTDTATVTSESTSPRSPPPSAVDSDVSSFPTTTPVKPPVQDTMPPVDKVATAVQQPEETSEPPATQVVESIPQTETAAPPRPEPAAAAAAELDTSVNDDNNLCLSKPGQLISIQPQNHASPTLPALCSMVAPYSGTSDRLEISVAAADSVTSACSAVTSAVADTVTTPPCQENGIAADHNEPEENQYDSPCQSLDEVVENVVHFSEEPSALNLDGQTSPSHGLIVNGEVAKETAFAPPPSTGDAASSESDPPPEAAAADVSLQKSGEKTTAVAQSVNTKYLLTAAGVGACALLMAWRWKN